MPKLKVANRFGIIPNQLLNDPKISWKAKWLFGYLQSKPDDWDFAVDRITNDAKDGRDGTNNGLKELENAGYLIRSKFKNEKGQWDIEYTLFDQPNTSCIEESEDKSTTENPSWTWDETTTENPSTENPSTENTETKKERNSKKETVKKIVYIEDDFLNWKILEFIENRKQLKKPMTDLAIQKMVNKCQAWKNKFSNDQISYFFDHAIEAGWQWLYEVFEKAGQPAKKPQEYQKPEARKEFAFTS